MASEEEEEFFDAEEDFEFQTPLDSPKFERYFTMKFAAKEPKAQLNFSLINSVKQIELPVTSSYWIVKFHPQGTHVAIAGSSNIIIIYPFDSENFINSPIYLNEHTYDITSLSWGMNGCLLSGSIDHTVKEWQIRQNSLNTFHFHCRIISCSYLFQDENFFIAAFEDFVVRIVYIPSKGVVQQLQLFETITCMAVSETGSTIAIGMNRGRVIPFTVRRKDFKLMDRSLIKAKNHRGLKKSGKKVTGLHFLNDEELLITTQDSNIRLYSLVDYQMKQKYKGADIKLKENCALATYDSDYVICGGDLGKFYIWETVIQGTKNRKLEIIKVGKHKSPVYIFLAPKETLNIFNKTLEKDKHTYILFCFDTGNCLNIYLL